MATLPIDHIEVSPEICGGKPHIAGRRITVQNIVVLHVLHHWPVEDIAAELELTPGQIHAALSYYYDHKNEIDRSIDEADALAAKVGTSIEELRGKIEGGSE
jgi:uncharacterized protein (DUF433 family)